MLFVKHNEKTETDKDKLKRKYNTLDDGEKLKWIQKAITAYEVSWMVWHDRLCLLDRSSTEKNAFVLGGNHFGMIG